MVLQWREDRAAAPQVKLSLQAGSDARWSTYCSVLIGSSSDPRGEVRGGPRSAARRGDGKLGRWVADRVPRRRDPIGGIGWGGLFLSLGV
jgi:hypothetical protein